MFSSLPTGRQAAGFSNGGKKSSGSGKISLPTTNVQHGGFMKINVYGSTII
jgi:hypothetical protein